MDSGSENVLRLIFQMNYGITNTLRMQSTMMKTLMVGQQQLMQYLTPHIPPSEKARDAVRLLSRFCSNTKSPEKFGLMKRIDILDENISNNTQSWDEIMQTGNWDEIANEMASVMDVKLSGHKFVFLCFVSGTVSGQYV